MSERHKRQTGIIRAGDLIMPVHVLGAGGIGSWTTLLLAKMGCENIVVYDNDKVEEHNVASQFFKESQLGMSKVEALAENVLEQTGIEIEAVQNIKEEEYIEDGLVVITIDSMAERIRLGKIYEDRQIHIIDGRMGGLSFEICRTNARDYHLTLVSPEDVEHDACTEKSICFNCSVIAGLIVNLVKQTYKNDLAFMGCLMMDLNSMTLLKATIETIRAKRGQAEEVQSSEMPMVDITARESRLDPYSIDFGVDDFGSGFEPSEDGSEQDDE